MLYVRLSDSPSLSTNELNETLPLLDALKESSSKAATVCVPFVKNASASVAVTVALIVFVAVRDALFLSVAVKLNEAVPASGNFAVIVTSVAVLETCTVEVVGTILEIE